MYGFITNRHILTHPLVTVKSFGWGVFWKAAFSGKNTTFLSLLRQSSLFDQKPNEPEFQNVAELLERSINLELRAMRLYEDLARTFVLMPDVRDFFTVLAQQEQDHADVLELCQAVMARIGYRIQNLDAWCNCLPYLEEKMLQAEAAAQTIISLNDAIQLVIDIESSEVNHVFHAICANKSSLLVQKMINFRTMLAAHISFISDMLPKLAPEMAAVWEEHSSDVLQPA
jgi:hypothetical protein